ncbi:hypothetical protein DMENIID0001_038360 [Sergentomyia squamirostris]
MQEFYGHFLKYVRYLSAWLNKWSAGLVIICVTPCVGEFCNAMLIDERTSLVTTYPSLLLPQDLSAGGRLSRLSVCTSFKHTVQLMSPPLSQT